MSWAKMPTHFSSACTAGGSCTLWSGEQDGEETISSGTGDAMLSALFDFVVPGSISFDYKVFYSLFTSFSFRLVDNKFFKPLFRELNLLITRYFIFFLHLFLFV